MHIFALLPQFCITVFISKISSSNENEEAEVLYFHGKLWGTARK